MILTAYYDESGTDANSPATVLAGFVGDTNDWVDVEIEWAKVMKAHKITRTRAKHLFRRQGQHKD
jgi:alpha/beta superfamily hydrolase